MIFAELLTQVQKLKCEEQRVQTVDYLEVVMAKEGLESLHRVLEAYFGAPFKPEGHAPSREASQFAAPYGGIRKEQTMYFRQTGGVEECAFLWPWGSGTRITVKLILASSSGVEEKGKGFWSSLFGRK